MPRRWTRSKRKKRKSGLKLLLNGEETTEDVDVVEAVAEGMAEEDEGQTSIDMSSSRTRSTINRRSSSSNRTTEESVSSLSQGDSKGKNKLWVNNRLKMTQLGKRCKSTWTRTS